MSNIRKKHGDKYEREIKKRLEKMGFIVFKPVRTRFTKQVDVFHILLCYNVK
jgi:Holliday junction resolvase